MYTVTVFWYSYIINTFLVKFVSVLYVQYSEKHNFNVCGWQNATNIWGHLIFLEYPCVSSVKKKLGGKIYFLRNFASLIFCVLSLFALKFFFCYSEFVHRIKFVKNLAKFAPLSF